MSASAYVSGIGILGPGLTDWPQAAAALSGRCAYVSQATALPVPTLLPPTERRRTGRIVKLAIGVAREAAERAQLEPAALRSVFTSSGGDGHNCHEMCEALAGEPRAVSPTRFANSVHNAAAGYWSIATGATLASTVLCAFDASFCAGLLEALVQVALDREPVMIAAYDAENPEPLHAVRPIPDAFGVALVLTPERCAGSLARIDAALSSLPADSLEDAALEILRRSIPAARALPLLRLLALQRPGRSVLEYLDASTCAIEVEPCG